MPDQEEKATVLIVDDSKLIRTMISTIIKKLGYNTILAVDGDSCIEIINKTQIHLVLLDIHMPGKSGIEVLTYIRNNHFTIPVVMISGSSDIEQAVTSLKIGAYDFLLKPIDPDRIAVTVKNALSEFELRQNLQLYTTAIEQNPLSIVITDTKGTIKYSNTAFTAISGYDRKEAIGRNMNILKSGKQSEIFYKKLWQTIMSGNIWRGELVNKKKNGELFWENATISPIIGPNNKISHFIGIKQDITQDKKKEADLEESERRFHDMADLLPQTIFEIDLNGKITYTNRVGFQMFGYSNEDLHNGVQCLMLFVPEDREKVELNIKRRLKNLPFDHHEYTGLKKDGSTLPILIYTSRIIRDGKPVGVRGIVIDISERKKTEEKLQELNKTLEQKVDERTKDLALSHQQIIQQEKLAAIGQLAAGIAHEINNPLNFIKLNFATQRENIADLLSILNEYRSVIRNIEDQGGLYEDVEKLKQIEIDLALETLLVDIPQIFIESQRGFERITTIINSMRSFSFKHDIDAKFQFDINKGILDTLIIAHNEYRYCADLETNLEELPPIHCNPEQISQVILNLVINSAHAIGSQLRTSNGKIQIHTWRDGNTIYCSIADDGPGITPEVQEHIFEPFFTTKKPGQGTGLGLSISYDIIVHKHNGTLSVNCPVEGGTVFTIGLPVMLNKNK